MPVKWNEAYKKFGKFDLEENSQFKLLKTLLDINIKEMCGSHKEHAEYVIKASFRAIGKITGTKKLDQKFTIYTINGYTELLQAHNNNLEKCLKILLFLANGSSLAFAIPIIVNLDINSFNVIKWLHSITNILNKNIDNSKNISNAEQLTNLYLHLSHALMLFINIETQHATVNDYNCVEYTESRYFLMMCMKCILFAHADQQYIVCFKFLDQFVKNIALNSKSKESVAWMHEAMNSLKLLNKKIRATLAQDNYIMLSHILSVCQKYLTTSMTENYANILLHLLKSIIEGLCAAKSTKSLCNYECLQDNIHACYGLYEIAMDVATKMVEREQEMESNEHFVKIILSTFSLMSKLTCKKVKDMQYDSVLMLRNFISMGYTKTKAEMIIPIVIDILKRILTIPTFPAMEQINYLQLLRKLFTLYQTSENWEKQIEIGYNLMAYNKDSQMDSAMQNYVVYWTTMRIKDLPFNDSMKTPNEYFASKSYSYYKLKLPSNFDLFDIACSFFKYSVLNHHNTLNEKYINQLIEYAAVKDTKRRAHFLHHLTYININQRTHKLLEMILKSLKPNTEDECVGLLYSKILVLLYFYMLTASLETHSGVHISVEFSYARLTSANSIFRQINFDTEASQLHRLQEIQQGYVKFIDFYSNKSSEEREKYADEKSGLFYTGKLIANHLILRGFSENGLQLYWKLHLFSMAENDEFEMIESCSYLIEYAVELKPEMKKGLNAVADKCNDIAKEKLKAFNSLISSKQNLLLNYMLNLITFLCENSAPDEQKILQLLLFVIGMVGGIDDEIIAGVFGDHIEIKTIPNKTFVAIRFKIYATIFAMITTYNRIYTIYTNRLMEHMLNFLRDNVAIVGDSTYSVALTAIKSLTMAVSYCQYHYEVTEYESLLLTMLKFVIRLGYTRAMAEITHLKLLLELSAENIPLSKIKFYALNVLIQNDLPVSLAETCSIAKIAESNALLCEPIRKEASHSKSLSPKTVGKNYVIEPTYVLRHPSKCECSLCLCPQYKFLMFRISCAYARYAYLNDGEFNPAAKRLLFKELFDDWQVNRNSNGFQKTVQFYLDSAQMLIWYSHYEWKFGKNYARSQQLLQSALKGLDKVNHYDRALKIFIKHSIEALDTIVAKQKRTKKQSNHKGLKKDSNSSSKNTLKSSSELTNRVTLLDMLNDLESDAQNSKFQIHDDETTSLEFSTPAHKSKGREKKGA